MSVYSQRNPIVVTHEGGLRFAAQVRSHRIIVDQPTGAGGMDDGPMPLELLGVSLGTCVALYVQQFLQSRELPYEGMKVEIEQVSARHPNRVGEFIVRIVLPVELAPEQQEMLERVARSCPAHNTLHQETSVRIVLATPATVG